MQGQGSPEPTPESILVEAAVRHLQRRFGVTYRLRAIRLEVDGPDGISEELTVNPTAWYLAHARTERREARHSEDYRSVNWFGVSYIFTPLQAAIVRQLWEAAENGTPDVGGAALLENAGSDVSAKRLDLVFRGHGAWKHMIVSQQKGLYRLAAKPSDGAPGD
jgi:hypothetical protein